MAKLLWLLGLNVFLVAVGVGISLLIDAILNTPEPSGVTGQLVLKTLAYVVVFQIVIDLQHRCRQRRAS